MESVGTLYGNSYKHESSANWVSFPGTIYSELTPICRFLCYHLLHIPVIICLDYRFLCRYPHSPNNVKILTSGTIPFVRQDRSWYPQAWGPLINIHFTEKKMKDKTLQTSPPNVLSLWLCLLLLHHFLASRAVFLSFLWPSHLCGRCLDSIHDIPSPTSQKRGSATFPEISIVRRNVWHREVPNKYWLHRWWINYAR